MDYGIHMKAPCAVLAVISSPTMGGVFFVLKWYISIEDRSYLTNWGTLYILGWIISYGMPGLGW